MDNDYHIRNITYTEIPELKRNIRSLEESLEHVLERLHQLEEKRDVS